MTRFVASRVASGLVTLFVFVTVLFFLVNIAVDGDWTSQYILAVTMVTAVVGAVVAHGFASWLSYSEDLLNWGAMMFVAVGFIEIQGVVAWNVLLGGAVSISLFCAGFYLVSLGLRDVAFPAEQDYRMARARHRRPRIRAG